MPKYDRLGAHLSGLDRQETHTLSFERIEAILGFPLPKSAREYQAWWANQRNGRHVQANSWLDSGWHTGELSLAQGRVTFTPVRTPRAPRHPSTFGLSIDEAKNAVAAKYGVKPSQVAIMVKG